MGEMIGTMMGRGRGTYLFVFLPFPFLPFSCSLADSSSLTFVRLDSVVPVSLVNARFRDDGAAGDPPCLRPLRVTETVDRVLGMVDGWQLVSVASKVVNVGRWVVDGWRWWRTEVGIGDDGVQRFGPRCTATPILYNSCS
jgi:hypothetical protein